MSLTVAQRDVLTLVYRRGAGEGGLHTDFHAGRVNYWVADRLVRLGLLAHADGGYVLTHEGEAALHVEQRRRPR